MNPDCHYGDHTWRGGGTCLHCGKRLRCGLCGQFVREDDLDNHVGIYCNVAFAIGEDERRKIEAAFA